MTEQPTADSGWTDPTCPVARTLDLVGDRWSLLIVRDAMDGARTFGEYQQATGIARNILTDRLRRLEERGIVSRTIPETGKRPVYQLTDAGEDLFTVVVALRQWGERNAFAAGEQHSLLVDDRGNELAPLRPTTTTRRRVDARTTSVRGRA
ncbi:winged helix-turn-helix transcriptional regulator [Microlunatus soli]|uniref:DNA-binding transcriptional regulator, HxlR family n=1 Tax=Microlunatus soli TaxID=630515 RepID=A0A1H1UTP8_9ACTN|nr:helix-turn-helix domain-containing protein [Microlunatus soli]SDS75922.1 DNA-binding transcriptional regulator, HxlR family [Microlunatus soli]